jgi:hypothetical protein
MVILFVMSSGELWVGNDENVNWPTGAVGTIRKGFVIDSNPALQKIGTLSSTFVYTAANAGEDPSNDALDASGGGAKFADIH